MRASHLPSAKPRTGRAARLRAVSPTAEKASHALDAVHELRTLDRIGETHMRLGAVTAEVDTGRDRNAGAGKKVAAELLAVGGKPRAVGVDEEAAGWGHGNGEPQLAQ